MACSPIGPAPRVTEVPRKTCHRQESIRFLRAPANNSREGGRKRVRRGPEGVGCQSGDPTARRSDGASDLDSGSGLPKLVGGIPRSGSPPFVAVMQTAHLRKRHDFTGVGTLHGAGFQRILVQSQVRATARVIAEVILEHTAKVDRVEDDDMIRAFAPKRRYVARGRSPA
jgi:hypothetical protein